MIIAPRSEERFSLVAGGPAHRLQQRLGLIKAETSGIVGRAALTIALTWIPLLVLSLAEGTAAGHGVRIPFLHDFAAYTRFLVAIPVLILAEGLIEPRVAAAVMQFVHSSL